MVTGEIMASFAAKPPLLPGAARRSDGKKRTTSQEKGKDFFFLSLVFSVGIFAVVDGLFVAGLRGLESRLGPSPRWTGPNSGRSDPSARISTPSQDFLPRLSSSPKGWLVDPMSASARLP